MTQFDALDERAARTVAVLHNEPVIWRPMRKKTGVGTYTVEEGGEPDDERPIVELEAIVSWRPEGLPVTPGGQGGPGEATVLVDFEAAIFEQEDTLAYGKPRMGDRLEMPDQAPGDQLMEIRDVGDDGSRRFYAWCSIVPE